MRVEAILNHEFKNGWLFLTKWEGFDVAESTWESMKSFVSSDSKINAVFYQYCCDMNLSKVCAQAHQRCPMMRVDSRLPYHRADDAWLLRSWDVPDDDE